MYLINRNKPSDLTLEVIFKVKMADKVKIYEIFKKSQKYLIYTVEQWLLFSYAENVYYDIALQLDMHKNLEKF